MNTLSTPPTSHILTILRGAVHLPITDIVRLEGSGNYTHFVLADGRKIMTSKSIGFYEPLLPSTFLRVNKPFLLNRFYIKAFGKLEVEMNDGFVAQVARRKRGLMKNTAQH
jgi:two-component system LytT family response regulator